MSELVLVIEDEKEIQELIRYNLERAGFRVAVAADGDAGLERLFASLPDALVLDLMLPGASGLDVLREVRQEPSTRDLPVLVVTARSTEMDKLIGFERGADDYLTKPFSPRELAARVKAILRRGRGAAVKEPALLFSRLRIDADARQAIKDGQAIDLTSTEFDILHALARHPGRVLSREQLIEQVWGYDYYGDERVVDVHIGRLRKKIEDDPDEPTLIVTMRGAGYRFEDRPQ